MPKRPKSGAAEDPREALVEAAYEVLAEKGLEGLRTRDIVARAGVNISTLHYHFGTKEDLLLAVLERSRDAFSGGPAAEATESLQSHLEQAWKGFQEDPRLPKVLQELSLRAQRHA